MTNPKVQRVPNADERAMGAFEIEEAGNNYSDPSTQREKGTLLKKNKFIALLVITLVGFAALILNMNWTGQNVLVASPNNVRNQSRSLYHSGARFGGVNNVGHPGGAKAAANEEGIAFADIVIPTPKVKHAIASLNRPNIVNHWGHYVHDEHRSPYASHLYTQTKAFLDEQQESYLNKMQEVREKWGAWNFIDEKESRFEADFSDVEYKDLPTDKFPHDAWQGDATYVSSFVKEARALVTRMQEGIYAEYGSPLNKTQDDGTIIPLTSDEQEERDDMWKIHVFDTEEDPKTLKGGIAKLSRVAFDGLVRKLLHAMMSNDDFFAVLGGHSAAAGHGNDFQQNRMITFQKIMEPVFDKLGMRLVSRNMGMGGVGTLHFTLAGGDLYGEADIMEWDSGMTERGPAIDLFNKQAILSGERVPVIMTAQHFNVMAETNGTAWMGVYEGMPTIPETTLENQDTIPYAARWFNEKNEKYNAVCWENRDDFTPLTTQEAHPGSQVNWHPGNRQHSWSGRKLALVLLQALQVAFDKWEVGIEAEGLPLAASYWHVGDSYKNIREKLRTHITTPNVNEAGDDVRSYCEGLIPWLPRLCRVTMHGFGMWNPRAHVDFDFVNLIHHAKNGYKPEFPTANVYNGFDLLPLSQAIPEGDIDVHAIAIATTNPAPELDHTWVDDDNAVTENDEAEVPPNRRWLQRASELAFKRGAQLQESTKHELKPEEPSNQVRKLLDIASDGEESHDSDVIVPGRGWEFFGSDTTNGFCDGSAQSECGRAKASTCLIMGHNDKHLAVHGNSLSGWLVFTVPRVREGIIMARMEWWCGQKNLITEKWTQVDDGKTMDSTPGNQTTPSGVQTGQRMLKPTTNQLVPQDLYMDYAINGVIKTMNRTEWLSHTNEFIKNVAVWPLLDDESMAENNEEGEDVEVAIRFRTESKPQQSYCISHVYYA